MSKKLIAVDSCSILHHLTQNAVWDQFISPFFADAFSGHHDILISEISIAECSRLESVGANKLSAAESVKLLNGFFRNSFIRRRGITSRESEFAADLIRQHSLGTCDALIAATAVYAGAEILYTSDGCTGRRKPGKLLTAGTIKTPCGKIMAIQDPSNGKAAALLNPSKGNNK